MGTLSRAQLHLAHMLHALGKPEEGLEAARSASEHARRTGTRLMHSGATSNEVMALMELGRSPGAEERLAQAAEEHVDDGLFASPRAWLAALRGDAARAAAAIAVTTL